MHLLAPATEVDRASPRGAGGYMGPDRRDLARLDRRAGRWNARTTTLIWRATGLVLGAVGGAGLLAVLVWTPARIGGWVASASMTATVLAGLLAILALTHVRWTGQSQGVWLALAAVLVALLAASGATGPVVSPLGGAARVSGLVALATALAAAVWGPVVDQRLRLHRASVEVVVAFVAVLAGLRLGTLAGVWAAGSTPQFVFEALVGGLLLALAMAALRLPAEHQGDLAPCGTWLLGGVGAATIVHAVGALGHDAWWLAGGVLSVVTLGTSVVGLGVVLWDVVVRQQGELYQRRIETDARDQRQQEVAHEARNALTAIEGATLTLERHRDRLGPGDRQELLVAVADEIQRLQCLVASDAVDPDAGSSFRVWRVVSRQAALARSRGLDVHVSGDRDAVGQGWGFAVAEALQNLLVNAERHARARVRVRVAVLAEEVEVRIEDEGPGVHPEATRGLFERGVRGTTPAAGLGLGLHVARRLVREQGGDLRLDERVSAGACFVLTVPSAGGVADQAPDQRDDGVQIAPGEL